MTFFIAFLYFMQPSWAADCVPAREDVPSQYTGQYCRVHPSGNYVLCSMSEGGKTTIVDITNRKSPKFIPTPLESESYPVEGDGGGWKLVVSPMAGSGQGTEYFDFQELLVKKESAKPVYTDRNFGTYYNASAELPGSTPRVKKIRTTTFGEVQTFRDYTMKFSENGKSQGTVQAASVRELCGNLVKEAKAPKLTEKDQSRIKQLKAQITALESAKLPLMSRTSELISGKKKLSGEEHQKNDAKRAEIESQLDLLRGELLSYNQGSAYREAALRVQELEEELTRKDIPAHERPALVEKLRVLEEESDRHLPYGASFTPALSKDGSYFAVGQNGRTRIYKLKVNGDCELMANLNYETSKITFGYSENGRAPQIAFTQLGSGQATDYSKGVTVYDLETRQGRLISAPGENGAYPGFTKDGRVIYVTYRDNYQGFVIVDPNVANGAKNECIRQKAAPAKAADVSQPANAGSAQ